MMRATRSSSSLSKEAVPDEPCDPRVEVMGDLKGKVKQVKLLNLDLTDQVIFPHMWLHMRCEGCSSYQIHILLTSSTPTS
jgi:hypothetical protein